MKPPSSTDSALWLGWILATSVALAACGDSKSPSGEDNDCAAGEACPKPDDDSNPGDDNDHPGAAPVIGSPIEATAESWTWVDFPDAVCGNGVATGIGLNKTSRSKDLLIFLEGGGACWDNLTCFFLQAASNITTGYTATDFQSEPFRNFAGVDRSNAANPLKDMSYVYVPYCTGDVHSGDSVQTYAAGRPAVHHKGAKNMRAYLSRLMATFPDVERVFLAGSSAGAYGAQNNYELVAAAFPNAEVHLLADCGQMVSPAGALLDSWKTAWNLQPPTDCAACGTDFTLLPGFLATKYPTRRFGLLAFTQDNVLRTFFGYSATEFELQTRNLLSARYDAHANAKYFVLGGSSHVMLDELLTLSSPGGVSLQTFVTQWLSGDAGWANVKPD